MPLKFLFFLVYLLIPVDAFSSIFFNYIDSYASYDRLVMPKEYDTIHVGSNAMEVASRLLGGRFCHSKRNYTLITYLGEIVRGKNLCTLEKSLRECICDIPRISFDSSTGRLLYEFGKRMNADFFSYKDESEIFKTDNFSEALWKLIGPEYYIGETDCNESDIKSWLAKSPMNTHPDQTLYINTKGGFSSVYGGAGKNCVHLDANFFKLDKLPGKKRVRKIVIEYLGDSIYKDKFLEKMDWSWLSNLHNMLTDDGKVYFEMRTEMVKTPKDKIGDVLVNIFKKYGFDAKAQQFGIMTDFLGTYKHIITRWYPVIRIEAMPHEY